MSQSPAPGASAIVSESAPLPGLENSWIQVNHARRALALISRRLFKDPTRNALALFGVTGTNGKTTTTYILASILEAAGFETGLFGTIEYRIGKHILQSVNTTPESVELYEHFASLMAESSRPPAVMSPSRTTTATKKPKPSAPPSARKAVALSRRKPT